VLKLSLVPHPDSSSAVTRVEVGVAWTAPDLLSLTYSIFGDLGRVLFPPARTSSRADGLWKHTCFEAFISAEQGYYEFNLSPSSLWAAYRFDGYRRGMREAALSDPSIGWRAEQGMGTLIAALRLPADVTGRLGLSAVIENSDGNRSFWALAHSPGPPDFHHATCFAAELSPAD
jgi:hypothetical protein